jgi:S1-C subfamily serine protease
MKRSSMLCLIHRRPAVVGQSLARVLAGVVLSGAWLLATAATSVAPAAEPAEALTADERSAIRAAEEARIAAIDSVYGSVVAIYGNDRGGGGSGVLYDPAGFALTNHHVVAGAGVDGWAGLADGKLYRWRLVGTDPGGDVAIIQLQGKEAFPTASLADSERVRVGDWAMAMGNPFVLAEDQRPTVTLGIVSGVHRFQPGSGLNQLVYGNCIQVDSSINPGNSGGPLFNLHGQVIGINGRGSFEERGRVNVGLGYAISANQVRNFIPELLSTKMAQHGTLDAQFGNRLGGVICQSINLDSPAAKAGLALGDRLISFEGVKIEDANQFTNLVSIYPADWPVALTFEHEGAQKSIVVRLTPLPYEPIVREQSPAEKPKPTPKDEGDKKEENEQKGDDEKPKLPVPELKLGQAKPNFGQAGQVRDAKLNEQIARDLVARWQAKSPRREKLEAITVESDVFRGETKIGTQRLSFTAAGLARAEYELEGQTTIVGYNGKEYWLQVPGKPVQTINVAKAHRDPHFAQATILAGLLQAPSWQQAGKLSLDGSDKAAGQLCYRLALTDPDSEQLYVWLSVVNDQLQPELNLIKSGVGYDDDEPIDSTLYRQWKVAAGVNLPHERTLVRSLAETERLRIVTTRVEAHQDVTPALFAPPTQESQP